ncbi:PREDICTED: patatin-like protein 2 [Prunus mume]|uniref:Patatin n=1 Tax=Prunus mume TaxID=102107 RepID=A0ABM1LKG4_PRUMU|nr:PREDICTED: patatin-like protein 2 [Prunus mume]
MAAAADHGKVTTILSIDGGGVRGLIPANILAFLESELKHRRPCYSYAYQTKWRKQTFEANEIKTFYFEQDLHIFPREPTKTAAMFFRIAGWFEKIKKWAEWLETLTFVKWVEKALRPKYNGTALHDIIKKVIGKPRLHETITSVIIPSYDIKFLQPVSTLKAKHDPSKDDVRLADVSIAASAAPYYFPPCYFEHKPSNGVPRKFNLIDGSVAANNPLDNSRRENLEHLEKIGNQLLEKPVSALNLENGLYEPIDNTFKHKDRLAQFAKKLSDEKNVD